VAAVSTAAVSRMFAILALLTFVSTVAVLGVALVARVAPGGAASELAGDLRRSSLWLGWIVALVTTLGSLYYSLVAHFEPCELCWYQRICVYPLAVVLLVAALRDDFGIWRYAAIPVVVGLGIAIYHSQLQAFPDQTTFCSAVNPCTIRYVWEFGFVSLPLMDVAALGWIGTMLGFARGEELRLSSMVTTGDA
jgi:disulfide bond formation protein DsbB